MWSTILHLNNIASTSSIVEEITSNPNAYIEFIENLSFTDTQNYPEYIKNLSNFSRLVTIRVFRPDLFVEGIR